MIAIPCNGFTNQLYYYRPLQRVLLHWWIQEKPDGRMKCRLSAASSGDFKISAARGSRCISCVRLAFIPEATYNMYI
jgi:hypothetical protein